MDSSKPPVVCSLNPPISVLTAPRIIEQYIEFIDNPLKLGWKAVLTNLEMVRNEWLNKAQLYFAFKRKQVCVRLCVCVSFSDLISLPLSPDLCFSLSSDLCVCLSDLISDLICVSLSFI